MTELDALNRRVAELTKRVAELELLELGGITRRVAELELLYATVITDAVDHVRAAREHFERITVELDRRLHDLDRLLEGARDDR